ncbi:MAG TPA: prolyl oligopeptidase family serine peptidase [Gemmatimonadaceae bacterium]|nr:prolyl oligopeptidase family serine peptidase [Gemmatimonadaceae bacterium]
MHIHYASRARRRLALLFVSTLVALPAAHAGAQSAAGSYTLEQIRSYPFPSELSAASAAPRVAWVFDERGVRNIYVAEGPSWTPRKVTSYSKDDGQELTNVSLTPDGKTIVYVRGGDHDGNWSDLPPDPASSPRQPKVEIWSVPFAGGTPKRLAEGDEPVLSPKGDAVAFSKSDAIWTVPIDGSKEASRLFFAKGSSNSPVWSPDGSKLAFVSSRGDHSFIAIYSDSSTPITYIAPSTMRDGSPRWSPDGKQIAFIRSEGGGGAPQTVLELHPNPFAIWVGDVASGSAKQIWKSPATLRGSYPTTEGRANLNWAAGNRIVFLADLDGWPHLYSIAASGGEPLLLTPGQGMAEYIKLSPDGRTLVFAGNMGKGKDDIDRRHVFKVSVDRAGATNLTPGEGNEWTPVVAGDGKSVVFLGGDAKRSPLPGVVPLSGGEPERLAETLVPAEFPAAKLVVPRAVTFKAEDGMTVHGQLFESGASASARAKKPAVIFVHGGPPRQMLLGWHYSRYYSNSYAVNQYLASKGYVVLSVNYRLGIGYGHEFHHPEDAGPWGASEYRDVKAGAEYLRTLPNVDGARIGIWGGSYGGFLTALALARNSDLFAAGVDMHGVHDWTTDIERRLDGLKDRYEKADAAEAEEVAWKSSPVSSISAWKSPVLLIQGDDDRNVRFSQTVDLARRLDAAGVPYEEIVLPDEIHDFLLYRSWITADSATAAYFDKTIGAGAKSAAGGR